MLRPNLLVQIICNYLLWFVCIVGILYYAEPLILVIASVLLIIQAYAHYKYCPQQRLRNWIFILGLTVLGIVWDSFLVNFQVIEFYSNSYPFAPLWMWAVWLSFSLLWVNLQALVAKQRILWAIISLLGFSFAYYAGALLGSASLLLGMVTIYIIGVFWMLMLPLANYLWCNLFCTAVKK